MGLIHSALESPLHSLWCNPDRWLCLSWCPSRILASRNNLQIILYIFRFFFELVKSLVTYGVLVSKRQEVQNAFRNMVIFQMIHQMSTVAFYLFSWGNGTKYYFRKALRLKRSETYSAYGTIVFDQCDRSMFPENEEYEPNDIWKMLIKIFLKKWSVLQTRPISESGVHLTPSANIQGYFKVKSNDRPDHCIHNILDSN